MKKLKTIYKALIILFIISACTEEDRSLDFLATMVAPTNVAAVYTITQDNTGLVTITPTADGATSFDIFFGDTTTDPENIEAGKNVQHTYTEGTFEIKVVAYNTKGDTAEATQALIVSFQAPQNLVATIENDKSTSKKVNITATAEFASVFEFYSGETDIDQPVATANIGEAVSYQYTNPGTYSVKVIAKGGAIETTEYTTEFEVTEILAPLSAANTPPNREATDVISIFSDAYTDVTLDELPTEWSSSNFEATTVEGNNVWLLTNLDFVGMVTNYANGIDVSTMEKLHIDYWVPDGTTTELFIKIVNTVDGGEDIESLGATVGGSWRGIDLDMTGFDGGDLTNKEKITQILIDSDEVAGVVYIDNFYFYKTASSTGTPIVFDDFEGNGNITTWAGDDCGMNTAFANPFKDGLNDSDTVLEYNDTGGTYANVRFDKDADFDLSGGNSVFTLKIYVPSSSVTGSQINQLSLKLQDSDANPWERQSEIIKTIALDTWQTLSFDFENDDVLGVTDPLSITNFRRVVLQVNSENNNDNVIAYLDDLSYGNEIAGDTAPFVKDSFEGDGTITTWAGDDCGMNNAFANPFKDALNDSDTVLEYTDTGGTYANVRFDITPNYDLTAKSKFSLKIYVPSTSLSGSQINQISLKLQDADANPWERQSEIIKEIALDTWQEVTFDFASDTVLGVTDAISITNFSRVVLQVNSENNNDTVVAYIDDINYFK
ncbi:hypothetical protein BTO04_07950 [Polaribacter sp. SA4-10]|uniref:hypothetical protein n=1 Tax=Polaribacter sp. SA4-10 TaxID=754397 RepID=UPI000B3C5FA7|nr:hypothetical protein [Polaribacter sp. SA4-10]ARV06632.1 hypothetical protein BTO04_07950 [Polaribacter sp. SA4-10]